MTGCTNNAECVDCSGCLRCHCASERNSTGDLKIDDRTGNCDVMNESSHDGSDGDECDSADRVTVVTADNVVQSGDISNGFSGQCRKGHCGAKNGQREHGQTGRGQADHNLTEHSQIATDDTKSKQMHKTGTNRISTVLDPHHHHDNTFKETCPSTLCLCNLENSMSEVTIRLGSPKLLKYFAMGCLIRSR